MGADPKPVDPNELALVQGMAVTRRTLSEWNRNPWAVLRAWLGWSLLTATALLVAVLVIADNSRPDPSLLALPGVNASAELADIAHILLRNALVLALHAMACVAGFIAGSSMPQQAAARTGLSRAIHARAGTFAIGFVVCATTFSLATQAYSLGHAASTLSAQFGISPATLLLGLLPHAVPELTALFLPLAAWVIASRRGRWDELLAATFATVAVAVPVLFVSAVVELCVSPRLIISLATS